MRNKEKVGCGLKLWVDALCINQADIDECSRQVTRMRDIYSKARSISVWLGENSRDDEDAIPFILAMYNAIHRDLNDPRSGAEALAGILRDLPELIPPSRWLAIPAFFARSYWRRVWIIQELVMGQSTEFLLGEHEIDLHALRSWASFAQDHFESFTVQIATLGGQVQDTRAAISLILRLESLNRQVTIFDENDGRNDSETVLINFLAKPSFRSIAKTLMLSLKAYATKDADKLYGLLGLIHPSLRQGVKPDYSLRVEEIYTNFSRSFIQATGYLDLIHFGSREGRTLPSWVLDWRKIPETSLVGCEMVDLFDGKEEDDSLTLTLEDYHLLEDENGELDGTQALPTLPDLRFSENGSLLHYTGIKIDTIDGCACKLPLVDLIIDSHLEPPSDETTSELNPSNSRNTSIIKASDIMTQPVCRLNAYSTHDQMRLALERVLLWTSSDLNANQPTLLSIPWYPDLELSKSSLLAWQRAGWDRSAMLLHMRFQAFRLANANFHLPGNRRFRDFFPQDMPEDGPQDLSRIVEKLVRCTDVLEGRTLITTDKGFVGVGPRDVRKGDFVFDFKGCHHPVVLRPCGAHLELVGACFIDSWTKVRVNELVKQGKLVYEDVTLC